jgi:hypothetical protein
MAMIAKTLYDTDFVEWTAHNAELLRQGRFGEVDLEHVAEEIENLGKRDLRAARSQLRGMLTHWIKRKIQPERHGLMLQLTDSLPATCQRAVKEALSETGLAGQSEPVAGWRGRFAPNVAIS